VEDARGHIDFVQGYLRLGKQDLRGDETWHETRERLQHLNATQQIAARLRPICGWNPKSVLQILPGNFQHEVRIELDEEVIAHCCFEGGDMKGESLIQEVKCTLDISTLAPSKQRLEESQLW